MFFIEYSFWGMRLFWWIVLLILLFWIFATLCTILCQGRMMTSPLAILQQKFAAGKITNKEYQKTKVILMQDLVD